MHDTCTHRVHVAILAIIFCACIGGICSKNSNAANGSAGVKQSQNNEFIGSGPVAKQNFLLVKAKSTEFLTELKDYLQETHKDCQSLPQIYYLTSEKSRSDIFRYVC